MIHYNVDRKIGLSTILFKSSYIILIVIFLPDKVILIRGHECPVNMNTKTIAIIAVVVIVIAGAGAGIYFLNNKDTSDKEINIVGRVNIEGSGLYLKEGSVATDYVTQTNAQPAASEKYIDLGEGANPRYTVFNAANWGGKVFATPGTATIQHVQLQTIVENTLGMKFKMFVAGESLSNDTVYFTAAASYDAFVSALSQTSDLYGAYIWEAQYSLALRNGCVGAITSDSLFPEHTCCVIAASHDYTKGHADETSRFLAAYVASVNKMNAAIAAGSGEDYNKLLEVASQKVALPDKYTTDKGIAKSDVIVDSLANVTYANADAADGSLDALKADVSALAVSLKGLGAITNSYSDLGFESADAFAARFVDDSFMKKAVEKGAELKSDDKINITVAVITGDVHQLAIHYGMELGIFSDYGVNVTLSGQTNGPGVATALQNGGAEFGFLGAPPITITVMNSELVTA